MIWSLIAVVEQLNWPAVLVECFEYADEADQWVGCECVRRSRRPGPRSYTALHLQSSRSASAVPSSLSASIQTHCYVMCYAERDLLAIDKFLCHGPGTLLAHVCEQSFTSHVDSYTSRRAGIEPHDVKGILHKKRDRYESSEYTVRQGGCTVGPAAHTAKCWPSTCTKFLKRCDEGQRRPYCSSTRVSLVKHSYRNVAGLD